jgi:hypothetical protein
MGNYFSRTEPVNHNEIEHLKTRLTDVERLDRNNDGLVTKEEFDLWLSEQKKDIEDFKQKVEAASEMKYQTLLNKNERELTDTRQEIKKLQNENVALKDVNQSLEKRLKKGDDIRDMAKTFSSRSLKTAGDVEVAKKLSTELSRKRIDAVVEQLLADPEVNIKYFPDGIERQIYRNIFTIMINLLDNLVDTTNIKFMGHKLVFDLQPLTDDEIDDDKENNNTSNNFANSVESKESKESSLSSSKDGSKGHKKKSRKFKHGKFHM